LTKQARWQAELLLMDMVDPSDMQAGLATAKALADSMNQVAPTVEHLPDWLARERAALSTAVASGKERRADSHRCAAEGNLGFSEAGKDGDDR
jgi:hypothetical protein